MKVTLITVGVATSLGSECEVLVSGKKTKAKQSQIVCLLDIMQLTDMNLEHHKHFRFT